MAYRYDQRDKSIVVEGFQNGIANSPFEGISDMRCVNIVPVPGEASVNFATQLSSLPSVSGNLGAANPATSKLTIDKVLQDGYTLIFSGGSLPTGITAGVPYLIKIPNPLAPTFIYIFDTYANYVANLPFSFATDGTGTFVSQDIFVPTSRAYDYKTNNYYMSDSNGRCWQFDGTTWIYLLGNDTTTTTDASGLGLVVYGDTVNRYLFSFRNGAIDYMNITTGAWVYGWNPVTGGSGVSDLVTGSSVKNSHYAIVGITDNIVYYCDANHVGSFYQKDSSSSFDPTDITTFTWRQKALDLPSIDIAHCLCELGNNLLIGGRLNAIYPWNRAAQVQGKSINNGYSYPILIAENFIHRMVTVNTNTYILAGQRGRIYITNGSQAQLYKKVPDHISGITEPYYIWGDLNSSKNQIYFSLQATANDGGTIANNTTSGYGAIWAIDLDTQAMRVILKMSYNTYGGYATVILPRTIINLTAGPLGTGLLLGWDTGASQGIDSTTSNPYTGSQATVDSDLIPIGTFDFPTDANRIEYKLTKPMVNGESVAIKYRTDFSQTYTTIFTDTATATYLPFSASAPINWKNAQWIQFQVVLNSTVTTPSFVRLKEIRLTGITQS